MFKVILWDIDNTLLDFFLALHNSLNNRFKEYGLGECSLEAASRFDKINVRYWEYIEKGTLTREEALTGRFKEFFEKEGISFEDCKSFNLAFETGLADDIYLIENGYDIVKSLKWKYNQYAVTNGAVEVQNTRLEKSGFDKLFDGVFISEGIGCEKPSVEFFDYVIKRIVPCLREEILIIGDSLTSDMLGGNNAKIKTCWYNPKGNINSREVRIDYEIKSLNEIYEILKGTD